MERPPALHVVVEVARRAALASYGVTEGLPVLALHGPVQAAASMSGRPAALALVGADHVSFPAATRLDLGRFARRGSVWHDAVIRPGAFVVPDLLADPRYRDHQVTRRAPGLRFYAGAPLLDVDGYQLGTLCVLDHDPGHAGAGMLASLTELAADAVLLLQTHRDRLGMAAPEPARPEGAGQTWLGVRTRSAEPLAGREQPGLIVLSVAAGSPAARAALRATDVLMSIDGQTLYRSSDVAALLANRPAGSTALLRLMRAGHVLERHLQLEAVPASRMTARPRH